MKVETTVSAFVKRLGMVIPFDTLKKAASEADDYDFMRISTDHYACKHGETVHILIVDGGEIGCSCGAMTFHCKGNDVCKHIAAFDKRSEPPQKRANNVIINELIEAGWRGGYDELRPPKTTSDPDGEDNEGSDPTPAPEKKQSAPEPPLGTKIWTRICSHCDQMFEGTDLDDVKKRHREHIPICSKNPANKAKPTTPNMNYAHEQAGYVDPEPEKPEINEDKKMETTRSAGRVAENATTESEEEETNMEEEEEETNMEEEEIIEPEVEETKKMYTHPDGNVFPSAEALLDYVDTLKAEQTTAQARRNVQHKPMIIGIAPRLQEIGRIAVGEKGGLTTSGKTRLPTKLDHFIFTTLDKDEDDRYIRDHAMMDMFGDHCTEIPIRLLYNDIELNFPTFYAKYARSGIKLRGDGENWTVYNEDGTRDEVFDPNNERGFLDDKDVKPHGILTVLVEGQNSVGGVYKFRTTSWNSINNILSSLALIKNMCGMLTYIPLKLVYRRKEVTPIGMAHKTWIPVVSVEFRGSIEELQAQASEVMRLTSGTQKEEMRQIEAAVRDHLTEDESIDEQKDVAAEFSPGVV